MAESSSSSTGGVQAPAVPLAGGNGGNYSEDEVRALRSKGIEAEKEDKWEEATEAYSRALELCCPDISDREAILARGFDPLLANLMYLYGTSLLYTYTQNTGEFGDKAQAEVEKRAEAIEGQNSSEAELLLAQLMSGFINGDAAAQADGDIYEEGDGNEEFEEDDDIDADMEASLQALHDSGMAAEAPKKAEEEEEPAKESESGAVAGEEGEEEDDEEEEAEGGEGDADAQEDGEQEAAPGDAEDPEAGDEPAMNDLELAWTVLEIARILYETQSDRALELSDVHFSLGNVAWEDEKFDDAKEEFTKALHCAEQAKERRAQAQVLLMISSIHETKNDTPAAVEVLEKAKKLLRDEITKIRATSPKDVAIEILESSVGEIESRIFSLQEKFVPVNPEDVKDLPDPSLGPLRFAFNNTLSGPAPDDDRPINVVQPRKKGQKRAAEDPIQDASHDVSEPEAKRPKASEDNGTDNSPSTN